MRPCWWPQNSEHSPEVGAHAVGTKVDLLTWPGIMSTLPPICGTQKLWITSLETRSAVTWRSSGHVDLVGGGEVARPGTRRPTTTDDRSP